MRKLVVTGANGFVGKNIIKYCKNHFSDRFQVIPVTRNECDLEVSYKVDHFFTQFKDEKDVIVMHFAGYVGGVKENSEHQYEMILRNTKISCNVVEACKKNNIKTLISALSTCIYPFLSDKIDGIVKEDDLVLGFEPTNYGYALAKSVLFSLTNECYKKGMDYKCVVPTNLFGPGDRMDDGGHFISRVIKKFDDAKKTGERIEFWGTGNEIRQFLYIDNFCKILFDLIDKKFDVVNILDEWMTLKTSECINTIQEFMEADNVEYSYNNKLGGIDKKIVSEYKLERLLGDLDPYRNTFSYCIYKYLKEEGFIK